MAVLEPPLCQIFITFPRTRLIIQSRANLTENFVISLHPKIAFPFKILCIGGLIFVQVFQIFREFSRRFELPNVDERLRRSNFRIVCAAVNDGNNVERQNFEKLFRHVVVAKRVFEAKMTFKKNFLFH